MKLTRATLEGIPDDADRPEPTAARPQGLCQDKGNDNDEVRQLVAEFGFTAHIRARGEEARALRRELGEKARRWVVERTHSWMNRFRGILIRWNKKVDNYIALLHMTFAFIIYRRMGLFG
jgi:transposase